MCIILMISLFRTIYSNLNSTFDSSDSEINDTYLQKSILQSQLSNSNTRKYSMPYKSAKITIENFLDPEAFTIGKPYRSYHQFVTSELPIVKNNNEVLNLRTLNSTIDTLGKRIYAVTNFLSSEKANFSNIPRKMDILKDLSYEADIVDYALKKDIDSNFVLFFLRTFYYFLDQTLEFCEEESSEKKQIKIESLLDLPENIESIQFGSNPIVYFNLIVSNAELSGFVCKFIKILLKEINKQYTIVANNAFASNNLASTFDVYVAVLKHLLNNIENHSKKQLENNIKYLQNAVYKTTIAFVNLDLKRGSPNKMPLAINIPENVVDLDKVAVLMK